jgi:hypothetical protein
MLRQAQHDKKCCHPEFIEGQDDNIIPLRRVKSGKALLYRKSTNPERVERSIAPGVNPGFGVPHDSWNPEGVT